jgi:hypothetical protein
MSQVPDQRSPVPLHTGGLGTYLMFGSLAGVALLLVSCGGVGSLLKKDSYTGPVTKENFRKIKGGMSEADVAAILGQPTEADRNDNNQNVMIVFDRGRVQLWLRPTGPGLSHIIEVVYCEHKVVQWTWIGEGGGDREERSDANYTYQAQFVRQGKQPPYHGKLTKASYDAIVLNKTTRIECLKLFDNPSQVVPLTDGMSSTLTIRWTEPGRGVEIIVNAQTDVVIKKNSNGLS